MSTKFLSPGWRMPRNANQSKQSNYSMDFDGSQKIDCGAISQIPSATALTVSCWLNADSITDSITTNQVVWGDDSSSYIFSFEFAGSVNKMYFEYATGYASIDLNSVITVGTWHHVVMVYDASGSANTDKIKFYIDGVDKSSFMSYPGSIPSSLSSSIGDFLIGFGNAYGNYFNGSIESVSIFDYALSPGQVTTLWGGGTSVSNPMALPSPPVAYYPLGTSAWNGQYLAENNAIGDYVFDFDANSGGDFIDLGSSEVLFNSASGFSFSTWCKLENYSVVSFPAFCRLKTDQATGFIIGLSDFSGYQGVFIGSDSNFLTARTQGDISSDFIGVWKHVVVTFDGVNRATLSSYKIYVDGQPITLTTANTFGTTLNDNRLGYGNGTGTPFNGLLSNSQIFNTNLSLTEVETLYNNGSPIRTLANIPQSSNLKAWYKLDASEVYNSSTTEWEVNEATSPWTSSLSFDSANNDKVDCGSISQTNEGDISFSVWCNLTTTGGYFSVLSSTDSQQRAGINIIIANNGKIKFERNQNISGTRNNTGYNVDFSFGSWNHLCGTFDSASGVLKAYVNGVLQNTSNDTTNSAGVAGNLTIGALVDNTGYSANGSISNVQIFNTALTDGTGGTPNQIEILYNNGSPLTDMSSFTSLLNWYKLDNLTTGIEDSKGSNNGTNYGATEIYGSVSTLNGESSGMSQANLVQSDLQTVAPYSKYALDFDASSGDYIDCGQNTNLDTGDLSASMWINKDSTSSGIQYVFNNNDGSSVAGFAFAFNSNNVYIERRTRTYRGNTGWKNIGFSPDVWHHLCFTYNDTSGAFVVYLNGVNVHSSTATSSTNGTSQNITIGENSGLSGFNFDGKLSNASIWNAALTPAQVTEIYNEGLPSNLNSHSAYSNLISWWQLGENSSFDGNDWIVADEKGTNNGTSTGMPVGALVNGVGTTANGVSSGMSEGNLVGDAPYSTANALSTNMVVTSRVTGSGNTP